MLKKEEKSNVVKKYGKKGNKVDSGSVSVQIALITAKIAYLNEHFKTHKKDHSSRRSLFKLVGKRRKFLQYLQKNNLEEYRNLTKELGVENKTSKT